MKTVEKMARAMWRVLEGETLIGDWDREYAGGVLKDRLMRSAVASLEAIREPSEVMCDGGRGWYDDHERSFTAMIDAAIGRGEVTWQSAPIPS